MTTRQYGKSDLHKTLLGMDFSKLEETAMQIGTGIHDSITIRTPTARSNNQKDAMAAMLQAMQQSLTGIFAKQIWVDELEYISPPPHLKTQVDRIIDKFWAYPGEGAVYLYLYLYLYLEQLRKNPVTKDLFKGESTTHHYPWYRRGTKY